MREIPMPSTYAQAEGILNGSNGPKVFANNTWLRRETDREIALGLYETVVVRFVKEYASDKLVLNTGGYRTNTTKRRINAVIKNRGMTLFQDKRRWFIWHHADNWTEEFSDNMTVRGSVQ